MINYKKCAYLGFIRPILKKTARAQVPSQFIEFIKKYEESGTRHGTVRGADLLAVMTVLRSKPPTHCWRGKTVIQEMKACGMGENKTKAVLSYLNQSGWIRYLKVSKAGQQNGTVTEVMYCQLPQSEASQDRLIRLDREDKPRIFRRDGEDWIPVPDEHYPTAYLEDKDVSSTTRPDVKESERSVWLPSERKSSERGATARESHTSPPYERETSEEYREDDIEKDTIEEDNVEESPISPLSEKGDLDSSSPGKKSVADADTAPHPGKNFVADDRLSSPGATTTGSDFVTELTALGRRSLASPADRFIYEKFVVEQLPVRMEQATCPELTRWNARKGPEWLVSSPAARVILALTSDTAWSTCDERAAYKRIKKLSPENLERILLGFDWTRHDSDSVSSLFGSDSKGWDNFNERVKRGRQDIRSDLEFQISDLNSAINIITSAESWASFNNQILPYEEEDMSSRVKFKWLYIHGLLNQVAFPAGAAHPMRPEFERKRSAWRAEMTHLAATSSGHLAITVFLKDSVDLIWGIDLSEVRAAHDEWMERVRWRAKVYSFSIERTFTHFFDFDGSIEETPRPWRGLPPLAAC